MSRRGSAAKLDMLAPPAGQSQLDELIAAGEPTEPPIWRAFASLLPSLSDTLLLHACLDTEQPARSAWEEWQALVGRPREALEGDTRGLKALLPLLHEAMRRNGIDLDQRFSAYLQAARLREELRSRMIREILRESLDRLESRGISPILLGGAALAETVYSDPALRHCHGLHLLVEDPQVAAEALGGAFSILAAHTARAETRLRHASGLPVRLTSTLVSIPGGSQSLSVQVKGRTAQVATPHGTIRVLAPADMILDLCARAALWGNRNKLCWVVDCWHILHGPSRPCWPTFLESAALSRIALPLAVMLNHLVRRHGAPIPREVIAGLALEAERIDSRALEAVILASRRGSQERFAQLLGALKGWRLRARLLRITLLPHPRVLRWYYGNDHSLAVAWLYLQRPILHAYHACRRAERRAPAEV